MKLLIHLELALLDSINVNSKQKIKSTGHGFAALSTLATDVNELVDNEANANKEVVSAKTRNISERASPTNKKPSSPTTAQKKESNRSASTNWTGVRWLFSVAVLVSIAWFVNLPKFDKKNSIAFSPSTIPAASAPADASIAKPLVETMPPAGSDNVLSIAQIRYCLAEKIRLDASETVID